MDAAKVRIQIISSKSAPCNSAGGGLHVWRHPAVPGRCVRGGADQGETTAPDPGNIGRCHEDDIDHPHQVPTTSGTGSEVTNISVITTGQAEKKGNT